MGAFELNKIGQPDWPTSAWRGPTAFLLLSADEFVHIRLPTELQGFLLRGASIEPKVVIGSDMLSGVDAVIVEVLSGDAASLARFRALVADRGRMRLVAAVRGASVADVRMLMRDGADDVIALPIAPEELCATLDHLRTRVAQDSSESTPRGRLISFIKSTGGAGATVIATQAGCLLAQSEGAAGREACLIDLDVQFGNVATYLAVDNDPSVRDLIEAGARVDGALFRSATTKHGSGLNVVAAPADIMPLDAVETDQVCDLVNIATQQYQSILLELPSNWTNWSLSLLARSDIIYLVTTLTVPALRQAARHIDMLNAQGIGGQVHVVANRYEKRLFKSIDTTAAQRALRRPISHLIANDYATVSAAIDQGLMLSEIRPKNHVTRDLATLVSDLAAIAGGGDR
jgi:pilus assembly protein CpaE